MSYSSLRALFSDIADAIRGKTGSSSSIKAEDFPTEISSIITTPEGYHDTSEVTATAADVLSPKKIVNAAGTVLTGSISSEGAGTYSAALNSTTTIPTSGKYFTGDQTVSAVTVENLSAENIKSGVTVKVKSGGNELTSVSGSFTNVKKLTKTETLTSTSWKMLSGTNLNMPGYIEISSLEFQGIGFKPDIIIAISTNNPTLMATWVKKSYSNYARHLWTMPPLSNDMAWWDSDNRPDNWANSWPAFKIPICGSSASNFTVFFIKE